jgi:hypothetical protein
VGLLPRWMLLWDHLNSWEPVGAGVEAERQPLELGLLEQPWGLEVGLEEGSRSLLLLVQLGVKYNLELYLLSCLEIRDLR